MAQNFRRRRHNSSRTSLKTYVLISVISCLVALGVQAFVKLTEDAKETVSMAQGVISGAVKSGIKDATKPK